MKCSCAAERSFSSEACHFAMNSFGVNLRFPLLSMGLLAVRLPHASRQKYKLSYTSSSSSSTGAVARCGSSACFMSTAA